MAVVPQHVSGNFLMGTSSLFLLVLGEMNFADVPVEPD